MSEQNIDQVIPKGCHYYSISLCNYFNPVGMTWYPCLCCTATRQTGLFPQYFTPYGVEYGDAFFFYKHAIPSGFSRLSVFPAEGRIAIHSYISKKIFSVSFAE